MDRMFAPVVLACATLLVAPAPAPAPSVALPPVNGKADYQLGGSYPLPRGVRVVTRDRTESPAASAYSICYVNAYQTQPGRLQWWKRHHPGLLLRRHGALIHDPGWPGEVLLDTSTATRRHRIGNVVGGWIAGCRRSGFRAVEPDNLDSFSRSHRLLTRADNLALARLLVARAHQAGLAIAQKNLAGLNRATRVRVGFDFAVAEECSEYSECSSYRRAYGRRVIEIEYSDNGRASFTRACRRQGGRWSIIYRDRELRRPGSSQYVYDAC